MRNVALLIAGIALVLTGCSAAPTPASTLNPVETVTETTEAEPTVEPLVAETTAPATGEEQFLTYVRENLPANTVIPDATDEQLLAAGEEACDRIAAGESTDDMTLIDGEQRPDGGYYRDSGNIITGARLHLCG